MTVLSFLPYRVPDDVDDDLLDDDDPEFWVSLH